MVSTRAPLVSSWVSRGALHFGTRLVRRPVGLAEFERRLVLLQTRDGYSLRGAARFYADCIVLSGAERVDVEKPVQLGGEVVVLRENISFFQTITQTELVASDDAR